MTENAKAVISSYTFDDKAPENKQLEERGLIKKITG